MQIILSCLLVENSGENIAMVILNQQYCDNHYQHCNDALIIPDKIIEQEIFVSKIDAKKQLLDRLSCFYSLSFTIL